MTTNLILEIEWNIYKNKIVIKSVIKMVLFLIQITLNLRNYLKIIFKY